jgi:hypothetical protein
VTLLCDGSEMHGSSMGLSFKATVVAIGGGDKT